jgi:3-hydroxybutyrate dehydrogenase
VIGSTSGIGLGIARALAGNGANVMLNGFGDADEIERTRQDLAAENYVTVIYSGANAVPMEIAAMIEMADHELGGVYILVNNAGIQHVAPIEEFLVEKWDAIIAINLSGAFHTTRLTVQRMKQKLGTHR